MFCFKPKPVKFGGIVELFKVVSVISIEIIEIEKVVGFLEPLMIVNMPM